MKKTRLSANSATATEASISGMIALNRRRVLKGAAAFGAILAMPSVLRAETRDLYVNTWGAGWTQAEKVAFFDPIKKDLGINVIPVTPVSVAKLKAMVESGSYEWDVTELGRVEHSQGLMENLWEPVNKKLIDPKAYAEGRADDFGVQTYMLSTVLAYRTDKFPNGGPKSWADFWDIEKFPGSRAMYNGSPWVNLAFALIADGVPKEKLYPLDLDRAFRKLDQIKPHIKVWWSQGAQSQQIFRDGEVDIMDFWSARAQEIKNQGVPIDFTWNGAENTISRWAVPRGAPKADLAWEFVNYATSAQSQAGFCSRMYYGPCNPEALTLMDPAIAQKLPSYPQNVAQTYMADLNWLAPRLASIRERWTQWLAS